MHIYLVSFSICVHYVTTQDQDIEHFLNLRSSLAWASSWQIPRRGKDQSNFSHPIRSVLELGISRLKQYSLLCLAFCPTLYL